jgi:hypothetical protein
LTAFTIENRIADLNDRRNVERAESQGTLLVVRIPIMSVSTAELVRQKMDEKREKARKMNVKQSQPELQKRMDQSAIKAIEKE